jgi:hypothetical protein
MKALEQGMSIVTNITNNTNTNPQQRQDDAAAAAATNLKAARPGGCYYCRYCKEDGHVVAECPQLAVKQGFAAKKARAAQKAERQCQCCGQKGHAVAQCTAKRRGSTSSLLIRQ